ncbi:hypothetical protein FC831_15200 [Clostridium botulinum]|nr:hypothetical protein [Clostridium botulinum]
MGNENIYDGCGIISSEILKKNFKGFEQGKIYDVFQFDSKISNGKVKYIPKNIYELSIVKMSL